MMTAKVPVVAGARIVRRNGSDRRNDRGSMRGIVGEPFALETHRGCDAARPVLVTASEPTMFGWSEIIV